jgi:hypothetical protein
MKRYFVQLVMFFIVFRAATSFAAAAGELDELAVDLSLATFSWTEDVEGSRVLKESGPIFTGGVVAGLVVAAPENGPLCILRGRGELFGGSVDYDGQTVGSNPAPVHTDTVYFGARGEGEVGVRFLPSQVTSLEPFAGVGYRWWRRDISRGGVLEVWQSIYARAGLNAKHELRDGMRIFARAGALYPFYNRNEASTTGFGDLTVKPGGDWSAFAEAGMHYGRFRPSVFYEGFRFTMSPQVGVRRVFQPDSSEDVVGLRLGWVFY